MTFAAVVVWLTLCVLIGVLATKKNRSFWSWFFISAFLSPIIGLIILLIVGDKEKEQLDKAAWDNKPVGMREIKLTDGGKEGIDIHLLAERLKERQKLDQDKEKAD
jgi:hypothetical protein